MSYRPITQPYPSGVASPPRQPAPLCHPAHPAIQTVSANEADECSLTRSVTASAFSVVSCIFSLVFWFGGEQLFALFHAAAEWLWAAPVGAPGYGQLPSQYLPAAYLAMICIALMSSTLAAGGLWLSRQQKDRLTRAVVGISLVLSVPAMLLALFVLVDHEHSPLRWLGW